MSEAKEKIYAKNLKSTHACGKLVEQIIKTELWMSFVKNLSSSVPRLKFLYKLMVKPLLFPLSNPLSHVNPSVFLRDNPKPGAAIPPFLRKASASAILFGDT